MSSSDPLYLTYNLASWYSGKKKKACFHCSKTDLCSFVRLHHNWKKCSKIDIFLWFAVKKKILFILYWFFTLVFLFKDLAMFTVYIHHKWQTKKKKSRIFPLHWVFATDVYIITASDTAIIKLCKVLITLFYSLAIKGWWGYCCHPAGRRVAGTPKFAKCNNWRICEYGILKLIP